MDKEWFKIGLIPPIIIRYTSIDESEAHRFIDHLCVSEDEKGSKILDLACGKGSTHI